MPGSVLVLSCLPLGLFSQSSAGSNFLSVFNIGAKSRKSCSMFSCTLICSLPEYRQAQWVRKRARVSVCSARTGCSYFFTMLQLSISGATWCKLPYCEVIFVTLLYPWPLCIVQGSVLGLSCLPLGLFSQLLVGSNLLRFFNIDANSRMC